jgi:hypothetical protein
MTVTGTKQDAGSPPATPAAHAASPRSALATSLIVLLVLLLATAASIRPAAVPPRVVGADAPATLFSAERAREHLRAITYAPRPVGSAAHAEARAYLVNELNALGLETEVQRATAVSSWWGNRAAAVQNIVARLPGTTPGPAVLLLSHYDSAPQSYGATDAGHGVAAILETVRALLAGPPLRNDVIVVLTDAEEAGLLGASAFVAEHPLAASIGVVLNLEARGNTGPVFAFRTSPDGGELVRAVANAPHAAASSLTSAVFRYIPNDTDLSVFLRAGYAGVDLANGHGLTHYHTPLDSFERADARTLQHQGQTLLSLVHALGNRDLTALASPDRVYFTLPAVRVVHYPMAFVVPLALGAALVVLLLLAWGFARGKLRLRGVLVGLLGFVITIVVLPALAFAGWMLVRRVLPDTAPWVHAFGYDSAFHFVAFLAAGAAVFTALLGVLRRYATAAELLAAPLVAWAALALASAFALPGGSYLFTWPLLGAAGGMAVLLAGRPQAPEWRAVALAALAVPALLIVPQVIYMLEVMLTMAMVAAPVALLALLLALLVAPLTVVRHGLGWRMPAAFAVLAVMMLATGLARAGFDADRPRPSGMTYVANVTSGEAYLASAAGPLNEWSRTVLGDAAERRALPEFGIRDERWLAPAPLLLDAAPAVSVVASDVIGDERRVRLRVAPAAGTWSTVLSHAAGHATDVVVDGRPMPDEGALRATPGATILTLVGAPDGGFDVAFTIPASVERLRVRGVLPGLPHDAAHPIAPRPPELMATGDFTLLERTIEL